MTATKDTTDEPFNWGSLGEARWRELGEAAGASELQLRFAALRHGGASASKAARLAGYKGDENGIRRAGYDANKSTAVQNLLDLAVIHAPEDANITDREIDAEIARMCRSQDANVSLKAIQLRDNRQAARAEQKIEPERTPDDIIRSLLASVTPVGLPIVWAEYALRNRHWHAIGLCEFVPYLKAHYPSEWSLYRTFLTGRYGQMEETVAKYEKGPVLTIDDILKRCGLNDETAENTPAKAATEEGHV